MSKALAEIAHYQRENLNNLAIRISSVERATLNSSANTSQSLIRIGSKMEMLT